MYTFFAHHTALHNESNRALAVSAISLLVVVIVVAIIVRREGNK